MASSTHKFQAPKGMRDFYPADMAVRRYIEGVWRDVSIRHGFEEIDGPTFEHTELYTHKSGPGIVSELFQTFSGKDEAEIAQIRSGKDAPYALRPEFTPTLARMVAARASALPQPIKWFAIPSHFRAERPQRGRLREFFQWNVDFIGGDDPAKADAEVIAVAVDAMERFGLTSNDLKVFVNDRVYMQVLAEQAGIGQEKFESLCWARDNFNKLSPERLEAEFDKRGITSNDVEQWIKFEKKANAVGNDPKLNDIEKAARIGISQSLIMSVLQVRHQLDDMGLDGWHESEAGIVRGLAYYTGTVFEIIAEGERAVAGGGRYDKLIESFGGPSMPACGFGMGDVVLGLLLHEKGLLPEETYMQPYRPHAFVISSGDESAEAELPRLVAQLRKAGYHVRHTYRATRNIGKLLGEAGKCRARTAIILDAKLGDNLISIKDLEGGDQRDVPRDQIESTLRDILAAHHDAAV